jgi:hypothetical protein
MYRLRRETEAVGKGAVNSIPNEPGFD